MVEVMIHRTNTILYCLRCLPTVRFYRDLLGLPVHHETDWMTEFRLLDKSFLSIADSKRATIGHAKGKGITLSFQIHDLNEVKSQLTAAGIETSDILAFWGAQAFYVYDPEGHRIEFWA